MLGYVALCYSYTPIITCGCVCFHVSRDDAATGRGTLQMAWAIQGTGNGRQRNENNIEALISFQFDLFYSVRVSRPLSASVSLMSK